MARMIMSLWPWHDATFCQIGRFTRILLIHIYIYIFFFKADLAYSFIYVLESINNTNRIQDLSKVKKPQQQKERPTIWKRMENNIQQQHVKNNQQQKNNNQDPKDTERHPKKKSRPSMTFSVGRGRSPFPGRLGFEEMDSTSEVWGSGCRSRLSRLEGRRAC